MRTFCGTILAAVVATTCMVGIAAEAEKMPTVASAKVPEAKHVFSMSCKVTAVNGDLATAEGRAKAIAWWKKYGFTKLWLGAKRVRPDCHRYAKQSSAELIAEGAIS